MWSCEGGAADGGVAPDTAGFAGSSDMLAAASGPMPSPEELEGVGVVRQLYGMLCDLYTASAEPVRANMEREASLRLQWADRVKDARAAEVRARVCAT
jgi:hypothetical protein